MIKLVINEKVSEEHGLSGQELLLFLFYSSGGVLAKVTKTLIEKGALVEKDGEMYTTLEWEKTVSDILAESINTSDNDNERLFKLAEKVRMCFPLGKMPGTPYYYRGGNKEVGAKLKAFFSKYGHYTDDEIVDATKRFVDSFKGNYRYLPLAKYFISKNKTVVDADGVAHIEEHSSLADYLENKEDTYIESGEWLSNVMN